MTFRAVSLTLLMELCGGTSDYSWFWPVVDRSPLLWLWSQPDVPSDVALTFYDNMTERYTLGVPLADPRSNGSTPQVDDEPQRLRERREAIQAEFSWSWSAYAAHAWGRDELLPLSQRGRDWLPTGSLGITILDSLDALILMGFGAELDAARAWVNRSLTFDHDGEVSTFEVTIRALGGLLGAHALTAEPVYLERATELGYRLLRAFETPSGLPTTKVNLRRGAVRSSAEPLVLSEVASLHLEFSQLSAVTGDGRFRAAVDAVAHTLANDVVGITRRRGSLPHELSGRLLPILMESDGWPLPSMTSIGAGGDSYYEYLLKAWLQSGRTEPTLRQRYAGAANAIVKGMVRRTAGGVAYLAELDQYGQAVPKMDHLACFVPGMLALGAATTAVSPSRAEAQMAMAEELMATCCEMYERSASGLAAEIVEFEKDGVEGRWPLWSDWWGEPWSEEAGTLFWEEAAASEVAERSARLDAERSKEKQAALTDMIDGAAATVDMQEGHEEGVTADDTSAAAADAPTPAEPASASAREFGSKPQDQHSLLRPETVESLFILWRLTHNEQWRERGWAIFKSIRRHARLESGGYASVESVEEVPVRYRDGPMESFWLTETLKYLFLLFSDDSVLPLDGWVLTTEAHPLPIRRSE